jgi:outer membrane protein assembly factor BamD
MQTSFSHRYWVLLALPLAVAACGGRGSKYRGMSPEELFQIATTEFTEENHNNAIEVLDRLLVAHGDWERVPDARLMLGDVYFDKGDFLTARSEYQRYLDRYPTQGGAPDASLGVCRSLAALAPMPQRDQSYTDEAMSNCRNVVIDYAGSTHSVQAAEISNELRLKLAEKEYLTGDFYFRRGIWFSAIKYYEFVANLYPESDFAAPALLGIYRSNLEVGYENEAEEARLLLLDRYPDSDASAEIRVDGSGL